MGRSIVDELSAIEGRAACTDAERRAANLLHDRLRAAGHEAWVETVWVRPRRAWSVALHCALTVVGGLLALSAPVPGLVAAALGALGLVAEALDRPGPLRFLMRRRATQNVLVEPRHPDRVALLVVAPYDAPRAGRAAPLRPWLAACALAVTATAAARVAGVEGTALGAVQLLPTIALLVGAAVAADTALAAPTRGADTATAVAAAIALLGLPVPPRFSAGLVLYGAGDAGALALRAHLRRERLDPTRTLIVRLGPGGTTPVWTARHPHLRRAAAATGVPEGRRAPLGRLPMLAIAGGDAQAAAEAAAAILAEL